MNLRKLLMRVKANWPWITKRQHVQLLAAEYIKCRDQTDRMVEAHARQIEDTQKMVDEVIRKLTFFRVQQHEQPPYDVVLEFTLDPEMAEMLRDPGLGGGFSKNRNFIFNLMRGRISHLLSTAFMLNSPNLSEWNNP